MYIKDNCNFRSQLIRTKKPLGHNRRFSNIISHSWAWTRSSSSTARGWLHRTTAMSSQTLCSRFARPKNFPRFEFQFRKTASGLGSRRRTGSPRPLRTRRQSERQSFCRRRRRCSYGSCRSLNASFATDDASLERKNDKRLTKRLRKTSLKSQ